LPTISGRVPALYGLPQGCAFQDRCDRAQEKCKREVVSEDPEHVGRLVRCFYPGIK